MSQHIFTGTADPATTPSAVGHHFVNTVSGDTWVSTGTSSSADWKKINNPATSIGSLNALTASTQTFAVGTAGTDFAITSATSTHTFDLPDASATARGVINATTQTIAGEKTWNGTQVHAGDVRYNITTLAGITGSDATITGHTTPFIRLTNASLVSVALIDAPTQGQIVVLANVTGTDITIKNDFDNSGNEILTGTGADATLANGAITLLIYDLTTASWRMLSGGGGGGSYTNEQAQDAVGGILTDSATIDFTYDDGANTITAIVISGSITNTHINSSAAIDYSKLATLTAGNVVLGNVSNVATSTALSGDVTVNSSGVTAIGSGVIVNADINASAAIDYSKLAALTDGNILVGSAANVATSVNPSGDIDVSNAGVFSINSGVIVNADINGSAAIDATKIANGSVTSTEFQYLANVTSDVQTQLNARVTQSSGSVTDNTIARYDSTTGLIIQSSLAAITDAGDVSGTSLTARGTAGAGYLDLSDQSSGVATPTGALRVYSDSTNRLGIMGTDGILHVIDHLSITASRVFTLPDITGTFTLNAGTQTLTNKTIDADSNTITNIENADIKSGAAISRNKTATGTAYRILANDSGGIMSENSAITASRAVASDTNGQLVAAATTATELSYVNGVTSAIQTQLDAMVEKAGDTMTGTLTLNADPVNPLEAATKAYVDALAAGLKWKTPVRVATTANGTLASDFENGDTIDGITLATNDRILLKDQTTSADNGIYVVQASGAPTRATDSDVSPELDYAAALVTSGTANAGKAFVQAITVAVIGVNSQSWVQFSGTTYSADGNGIELTGTTFSLELDGSTLSKSGTGLKVNSITSTVVSDFTEAAQDAIGAMLSSTDLQYTDGTPLLSSVKTVEIKVFDDTTTVTTGDGKYTWIVPSQFNGRIIRGVFATVTTVSSSGTPTVQIHNLTDAVDVLSTSLTIDASEYTSDTAATPAVINTSNDDLATGDRIRIDVDVAGTGAKGLSVGIIIGV